MKKMLIIGILFRLTYGIAAVMPTECKNLKQCADYFGSKTGQTYTMGNLEKRGLRIEKDFNLTSGDPDFIFSYILSLNLSTLISKGMKIEV